MSNNDEDFNQQLTNIFKFNYIENLLFNQEIERLSCCTVFIASKIEYSNKLLNFPEMFKNLSHILGIEEALNLGKSMMKNGYFMTKRNETIPKMDFELIKW